MDNQGLIGELLEKGQNAAVAATKQTASDITSSVSDQVGLPNETSAPANTQNTNSAPSQQPTSEQSQAQNTEGTDELIQEFYAPSELSTQPTAQQQEEMDTEQELVRVRQRLHQEQHNKVYFNDLNNPRHDEEKVADKIEREDQEEMQDLQVREAQKPDDSALRRNQISVEIAGSGAAG